MRTKYLLAILALLLFSPLTQAEDPPLEDTSQDLETIGLCFDLAVEEIEIDPSGYDSLHAFFTAAKEATQNEEHAVLLAQVDLSGDTVRVGDHHYTGSFTSGHDSYEDGSTAFWTIYEISEVGTGRTQVHSYNLHMP